MISLLVVASVSSGWAPRAAAGSYVGQIKRRCPEGFLSLPIPRA